MSSYTITRWTVSICGGLQFRYNIWGEYVWPNYTTLDIIKDDMLRCGFNPDRMARREYSAIEIFDDCLVWRSNRL